MCRLNVVIDSSLIHRLIASQFPPWKGLSIPPIAMNGCDDRTSHLGKNISLRLPGAAEYELQVEIVGEFIAGCHPASHDQMELAMKDSGEAKNE